MNTELIYYLMGLGLLWGGIGYVLPSEIDNAAKVFKEKKKSKQLVKIKTVHSEVNSPDDMAFSEAVTGGHFSPSKNEIALFAYYLNRKLAQERPDLQKKIDDHNRNVFFVKAHEKKHAENAKLKRNTIHLSKNQRIELLFIDEISAFAAQYLALRDIVVNKRVGKFNMKSPISMSSMIQGYLQTLFETDVQADVISETEAKTIIQLGFANFMDVYSHYENDFKKMSKQIKSPTERVAKKLLFKQYPFEEIADNMFSFDIGKNRINLMNIAGENFRNEFMNKINNLASGVQKNKSLELSTMYLSNAVNHSV